jgi:hypothetical protein
MQRDISQWEESGEEFFAFYQREPGTQQLNAFWAPSPDRYNICREAKAQLTWSHRFTYYAYVAEKYYILRAISGGVERYRITTEGPDDEWAYLTSFWGFLDQVPGTLHYYIQEKEIDGFTVCKVGTRRRQQGSVRRIYTLDIGRRARNAIMLQQPLLNWIMLQQPLLIGSCYNSHY